MAQTRVFFLHVYVNCDLDLGDKTLDYWQQLYEIWSKSNMAVKDFAHMYSTTLTLETWPLVKDNNFVWYVIQIYLEI